MEALELMLFWPSSNKIKGIGSGERRKRKAGRGRGGKRKEGDFIAKFFNI
jgi:hypothetical protein